MGLSLLLFFRYVPEREGNAAASYFSSTAAELSVNPEEMSVLRGNPSAPSTSTWPLADTAVTGCLSCAQDALILMISSDQFTTSLTSPSKCKVIIQFCMITIA